MSYFAHRDPKVFSYPEEFVPERWLDGKVHPNLFTFGGGPRECVGRHFVHNLVRRMIQEITTKFRVSLVNPAQSYKEYKWLPVSRPAKPVLLTFTPITPR
jgi:cytochrome P450